MAFCLVRFWEKGQAVESVVPKCWIKGKNMYWSNSFNAKKDAMQQKEIEVDWKMYEIIKIVFEDDDYQLCEDYNFSSSQSESPVKKKRAKVTPRRVKSPVFGTPIQKKNYTRFESDDEQEHFNRVTTSSTKSTPTSSSTPKIASTLPGACAFPEPLRKQNSDHNHQKNKQLKRQEKNLSRFEDGGTSFKEMSNKQFQYTMLMELRAIKANQERLFAMQEERGNEMDVENMVENIIALTTLQEFDEEEQRLLSREKRRQKKTQIKRIGGRDARSSARMALDGIMSREVQTNFSKDGLKGKRAFSQTQHYKCLLGALVEKYTKHEIDFLVGDLLKRAVKKKEVIASTAQDIEEED